jgi:cell division GTPase FtsZ
MGDEVHITVVATGFDTTTPAQSRRRPSSASTSTSSNTSERQQTSHQQTRSSTRSQIEMQVPQFSGNDELDIPPFLRRR